MLARNTCMKLNEVKKILQGLDKLEFQLPDGSLVPTHFHVTEVGKITKEFIDCGGQIRHEKVANLQLWEAEDYNHRLHPEKLISIIELSQRKLGIEDLPVEVEYQQTTIGKFSLEYKEGRFLLTSLQTACLAREDCGLPKIELKMSNLGADDETSCNLENGCC